MAEATDAQMQLYANERIRPRAEQIRALINALNDDKAAIDAVYARAVGTNPWTDARTDPPKILNQQDILTYNAFISLLLDVFNGVGGVSGVNNGTVGEQKIFNLHANLAPFQAACVRPVNN